MRATIRTSFCILRFSLCCFLGRRSRLLRRLVVVFFALVVPSATSPSPRWAISRNFWRVELSFNHHPIGLVHSTNRVRNACYFSGTRSKNCVRLGELDAPEARGRVLVEVVMAYFLSTLSVIVGPLRRRRRRSHTQERISSRREDLYLIVHRIAGRLKGAVQSVGECKSIKIIKRTR